MGQNTRGVGHVQPLLPYAHAMLRRGHDVRVAAPQSVGSVLQKERLEHAQFDHPGDDLLGKVWVRFRGLTSDEINVLALEEIFAGLNARAALPGLRETIHDWRPNLIVRESVEYGALIAADEAGLPHARVAVHNGRAEELLLRYAPEPVDVLRIWAGHSVRAGEKVGHGSGGVVLLRAAAKGGQWLAFPRVIRTRGMAGDVWLGQLCGGAAVCFR